MHQYSYDEIVSQGRGKMVTSIPKRTAEDGSNWFAYAVYPIRSDGKLYRDSLQLVWVNHITQESCPYADEYGCPLDPSVNEFGVEIYKTGPTKKVLQPA